MPPKKTLQVRRDEWTDEVVKVRRALEAAFTTHHLGPPCLPKLAPPGSVAARPVYMETPKKRSSSPTIGEAIADAVLDAANNTLLRTGPNAKKLHSHGSLRKLVLDPLANFGMPYEDPTAWAAFDVDAYVEALRAVRRGQPKHPAGQPCARRPQAGCCGPRAGWGERGRAACAQLSGIMQACHARARQTRFCTLDTVELVRS